ncbi:MAG: hypothetical protein ACOVRK_01880 [Chryseobacterium taeanense]
MQIISIILSIVIAIIIMLVAFRTNLLRETNVSNSPFSFSRFQVWLWTLIIIPAFVLNWGFVNSDLPRINETAIILLGMSLGVTVTSAIISNVQKATKDAKAQFFKSDGESKGFWIDILLDDNGQLSNLRLQNLVFTFVYVVIYVGLFFSKGKQYPDFDQTAYALMGISSSAYLLGKSLRK